MVDAVKNYGIAGVDDSLELGKQGPVIDATSSSVISLKDKDGSLENIAIANGTHATHAVNKAQFDQIVGQKISVKDVNFSYNSGEIAFGNAQANTTIQKVMVEKDASWTNANSTTEVTVGDTADVDRLFAGFDPAGGQHIMDLDTTYGSTTAVRIYVTQGGATAGTGQVRIFYTGVIS